MILFDTNSVDPTIDDPLMARVLEQVQIAIDDTNEPTTPMRVIVSYILSTTCDAIDMPFEWQRSKFILIDTAVIQRK